MASTTRPNVKATPTCETPPWLVLSITIAPVPANTRANVPNASATSLRIVPSHPSHRRPVQDGQQIELGLRLNRHPEKYFPHNSACTGHAWWPGQCCCLGNGRSLP